MPIAVPACRRNEKSYSMYAALYPGPAVECDAPTSDASGYARSGSRQLADLEANAKAVARAATPEHIPAMQVAFFNKDGKEPIRDPSYRRLLVEFERRGDFMVNAKAITFPAATRSWGVIDEARIFDEEGDELFSCEISHPPHISAGCIICFQVCELHVTNQEWDLQLGEWPAAKSKPTVHKVGSKDISFSEDTFFFSEKEFTGFDPGLTPSTLPEPKSSPGAKLGDGFFSMLKAKYGPYIEPTPVCTPSDPLTPEKIRDYAKLIADNGSATPQYNFPVLFGIENGQHPYPCKDKACMYAQCGGDGSDIKPFSIPVVPEMAHGQSIGGEPDKSEKYNFPFMPGVDHRQNFGSDDGSRITLNPATAPVAAPPAGRNFLLADIMPAVAAETPIAPPGVIPPVPPAPSVPQPEPEEDQAAIRAHNLKIMLGG